MQVAGVDGCRGGWLVVRAEASGRLHLLDISIVTTFEELIASTCGCLAVAVDIPIGLVDGPDERIADKEARRMLGKPGASSVFPAPVRRTLEAETHDEAKKLSLLASGKSMNIQTFSILKRVREADDAMTPALQERIVEVHPEVSFCALNRAPLRHSKTSPAGALKRLELISRELDYDLEQTAVEGRATFDDFLDACAAAWTAQRHARKEAKRLPPVPPRDSHGLRMEIVY